MEYSDFSIRVDTNEAVLASSDRGECHGKLDLDRNEIDLAMHLIDRDSINEIFLKKLGNILYNALLDKSVSALFAATKASADQNSCGVRIRLIFENPELAALPWEFLYDQSTNIFLATDPCTLLSRYIDVPQEKKSVKPANLPLKLLLVISSPNDLDTLDSDGESELIKQALKEHTKLDQIEIKVLTKATIEEINNILNEKSYDVFHFIGHGIFNNRDNKGYIALMDENANALLLDDERFTNLIRGKQSPSLVVLNACEGAAMSSHQIFAGIAPRLVQRGIPAVIAMQHPIQDRTAKFFADAFYRSLALAEPVDKAIQSARNFISIKIGLNKRDFATPVLYMRAKDGAILELAIPNLQVTKDIDPFRKLASLIIAHEEEMERKGKDLLENNVEGMPNRSSPFEDYERFFHEYQELEIGSSFPEDIIEKLDLDFKILFLCILNTEEDLKKIRGVYNKKMIDLEIARWLNFNRDRFPDATSSSIIESLRRSLNEVNGLEIDKQSSKNPYYLKFITDKINMAFMQSETLLQLMLSFYGRIICGKDYISVITQFEDISELNLSNEDDISKYKKNLDFMDYIRLLNKLDRWFDEFNDQGKLLNINLPFQRKRLFPDQMNLGEIINVPIRDRMQIIMKDVAITERDTSPFIERLRMLNNFRELYVISSESNDFMHLSNIENIHKGAIRILRALIDTWNISQQQDIFPQVVIIRRLLLVDANLVRIDYLQEGSSLKYIRVYAKYLPTYTYQLIGKPSFLQILSEERGIVSNFLLYPVDEELQSEASQLIIEGIGRLVLYQVDQPLQEEIE